MKKKIISFPILLTLIIFSLIGFYSCKKSLGPGEEGEEADKQKRTMEAIQQQLAKDGKGMVLASGLKGTSYISDADGNNLLLQNPAGRILTTCTDANDDQIYGFDETVLESCTRSFLCGEGYKVKTSWLITTPLPLTTTGSKGRLRLKNTGGTVVYSNTNITPVSIVVTGLTNSNYPGDDVYRVTYESPAITKATYESATSLENGVLLVTTCPTTETVQYLATYSLYIGGTASNPCTRIDIATIMPPNSEMYGSVAGCDAGAGCQVDDYTLPNQHEIEFIAISGGAVGKTAFINNWEAKSIVPITPPTALPSDNSVHIYIFTGTYQIRFRNSHSCSPAAPWSEASASIAF